MMFPDHVSSTFMLLTSGSLFISDAAVGSISSSLLLLGSLAFWFAFCLLAEAQFKATVEGVGLLRLRLALGL
jgi:hypothetical protein